MSSRLWAIPDIHGRSDLLDLLISTLRDDHGVNLTQDKLIFLGDYVDGGTKSAGVLNRVRDLCSKHPKNVFALCGNHEDMMIEWHNKTDSSPKVWELNGHHVTLDSFPNRKVPREIILWLESLPVFHKEHGFFFSHAPVPRESRRMARDKGKPFTREELTWSVPSRDDEMGFAREHNKESDGTFVVGVYGHVNRLHRNWNEGPRLYPHALYLDAGCGRDSRAPLIACEVKMRKVVKVYGSSTTVFL